MTATASAFDQSGKLAIVTGATRGIGLAIAKLLTMLRARIVVSSEDENDCELVASRLGGTPLPCDLADGVAAASLPTQVLDLVGPPDILVLNPGIPVKPSPFTEPDLDDYRHVVAVNLNATVILANGLLPLIAARGGGVLMSRIASLRGDGAIKTYSLCKAAIAQLARNLPVDWGARTVRVNAISPRADPRAAFGAPHGQRGLHGTALGDHSASPGRRGHEVAGAMAFLASAAGGFVNGHNPSPMAAHL